MTRKGTEGGELAKITSPASQRQLIATYHEIAREAVAMGGRRAMELPAPRTSAAHEAGHAVLQATTGKVPYLVEIWYVREANGYAGECSFGPEEPELIIDPITDPRRTLLYAANLFAGPVSELLLAMDDYRLGSSLDEYLCAVSAVKGAAQTLKLEPEWLLQRVMGVVVQRLEAERPTLEKVQRILMREQRVRGPKLAALLAPVRRLDVASLILRAGGSGKTGYSG